MITINWFQFVYSHNWIGLDCICLTTTRHAGHISCHSQWRFSHNCLCSIKELQSPLVLLNCGVASGSVMCQLVTDSNNVLLDIWSFISDKMIKLPGETLLVDFSMRNSCCSASLNCLPCPTEVCKSYQITKWDFTCFLWSLSVYDAYDQNVLNVNIYSNILWQLNT